MMTKLQRPHGASHKRGLKCSATVVRILLHGAKNNKNTRLSSESAKDFHHQKGVSS
jgi:hypothetical protein